MSKNRKLEPTLCREAWTTQFIVRHTADQEVFATRAEVEQKFAEAREEIDARYAKKVETAEEQRLQQHSRNLEKREDAFGRVGLNPNGSDPHDRPQAVVDRESRRVVETTV